MLQMLMHVFGPFVLNRVFTNCQTDDWQNRFTDLQTSTFYHQHLHNLRVCPMVAKIIGHYERALKRAPGFTTGTVAGVPDP